MKKILIYLLFFFFLILWEFFARLKPELFIVFPPISQIINCFIYSFKNLLLQSIISLQSILGSFFLAFGSAFLFAWIMISLKKIPSVLQNTLVILQSIPLFAIVPLIVIWFGFGKQSIVIPTALMIFFPLTLNILHGFQSVPKELLDYFYVNKASSQQIFYKLRLPYAVPHIFSGLKIAAGTVGVGVLSGEWIAGYSGLGILILESRRNYEIEMMFSALIMLSAISVIFYRSLLYIEKKFFQKYYSVPLRKSKFKFPFKITLFFVITLITCKALEKYTNPSLPLFFTQIKKSSVNTLKNRSIKEISSPFKATLCLDWVPNPNHIPLYVALDKGFFKNNNLSITIKPAYGDIGLQVTYLLHNKVDLILYNLYGIVKANLKGLPLQAISSLTNTSLGGFLCRKEENLTDISDLNNKTFGFCLGNSKDISIFNHIFANYNITPKKIVNVSSDLIYPMLTKKIDVLYGGFWNIEGPFFESLNLKTHAFLPQEYGQPNSLDLVICTSRHSIYSCEDFVKKFRQAIKESIAFCQEHISEAFNIYEKYCPNKTKKCLKWKRAAWETTVSILDREQTAISEDTINAVVNCLITNNHNKILVNDTFDIASIFPY